MQNTEQENSVSDENKKTVFQMNDMHTHTPHTWTPHHTHAHHTHAHHTHTTHTHTTHMHTQHTCTHTHTHYVQRSIVRHTRQEFKGTQSRYLYNSLSGKSAMNLHICTTIDMPHTRRKQQTIKLTGKYYPDSSHRPRTLYS